MNQISTILEKFPLLLPICDFKIWNGFIFWEGEEVPVTMSTPYFPSLKDFSLMCPVNMERKIYQKLNAYEKQMDYTKLGLLQLLEYLKSSESSRCIASLNQENRFGRDMKPEDRSLLSLDYYLYSKVLSELKQLGSEKIMTCSRDLSEVTLRTVDERGVEHTLVVGLSPDYPYSRPAVVDMNLPDIALSELSQAETIIDMHNLFKNVVDSFQDFWNTYESLVKNTWLIDPENPSLKDTHCRIIIGDNVSMIITLNPQDVNTCPDIIFLGPESAVIIFINAIEKKLKTVGWNEDVSVLENLLSLLSLSQFPQREEESEKVLPQDECSICFMMRLEDEVLPTKVCNNTKCNSYFHITCLAQWFQAVPTNESSFNLISGDCPCCGQKILCPMKMS